LGIRQNVGSSFAKNPGAENPVRPKPCPSCSEKDALILDLLKRLTELTEDRNRLKAFDLYKKAAQKELVRT